MADGFRVAADDFHAVTMNGQEISFGPFRLLADQRLLLEGDRPVRLGSRAFDILVALVESPGEVLGKEQLIARAWPQTFVEESNLKMQISALRCGTADLIAAKQLLDGLGEANRR
jgi:DNA-binding winged helix-turn-helix (wHTH) protein